MIAGDISGKPPIGALLRAARTEKNLTITAAAEALRTREAVISALENDDYSLFSADMYARGFIRNYARILGLNEAPLLESYQAQFAKNDPDVLTSAANTASPITFSPDSRKNLRAVIAATAVGVFALITVISVVLGGRTPDTASVNDIVDVAPQPAPQPDDSAPPTSEVPPPEPVVPIDGVELLLALEQASWLQVFVDGVLVLEETVRAGETLQYRGGEVRVRFGNAGGVFAELNGEDLGAQGGRGEVVNVRFTRDGADVL